jgi:hypothetical protein
MSAITARTRIDKALRCHNRRTKRVIKLVVDQQSGIGRDARTAERRLEAAIERSPRNPEITIRIFSSEEYRLRALRRISRTCCSELQFGGVCFIGLNSRLFRGNDEPKTLRYANYSNCLAGPDGEQAR